MGMTVDALIGMNTRVLNGWLGSKISAGQSGGILLLGQLGPFHFSLTLKVSVYSFLHFLMHLDFHWQIYLFVYIFICLFIYSLNYLFLNFWYFFIHKFNWFPQIKIVCVFECSFCSFTVRACLWVSVSYFHVCLHIPL